MHIFQKSLLITFTVFIFITFTGCKSSKPDNPGIISETDTTLTFTDTDGKTSVITKKPQRVIVVHGSLLALWHQAGGKAIGRPKVRIPLPEELKKVQIIGGMTDFNSELILTLQPDLVLLSANIKKHKNLEQLLDTSGIENIRVHYNNYNDYFSILDLFTRITGKQEIYKKKSLVSKKEIKSIIGKCPTEGTPSYLLLFNTTRYVKCELSLPITDTGYMLKTIGARNIVTDVPVTGSKYVDFSMEQIILKDPDYIFIKTMGDLEKCKTRMQKDIKSHPAWSKLRAVKAGKVYFLPKDLFMYKANERYPEAFRYLATILYPDIFL